MLPTPRPSVTLFNSGLPTMSMKTVASGNTTVTGLWPFPNGYSVWAGTCEMNDPAKMAGTRSAPSSQPPADRPLPKSSSCL